MLVNHLEASRKNKLREIKEVRNAPGVTKTDKRWEDIYKTGEYATKHPSWHVEDSRWKATHIMRMLERNRLAPQAICEIGCGAGEILNQLQQQMGKECRFWGYEISPQAFELCQQRANDRLHFELQDIRHVKNVFFDLILLIDLLEHIEDYFGLLRDVRPKSTYKILHIPLDISVQTVLRTSPFRKVRAQTGHIHYFTKEIALAVLADVGYEVMDWFYTAESLELPPLTLNARLARPLRKLLFAIHRDLAARLMGGFALMILARTRGDVPVPAPTLAEGRSQMPWSPPG